MVHRFLSFLVKKGWHLQLQEPSLLVDYQEELSLLSCRHVIWQKT